MFNDIWIARKSALSLARSLMVATMVIAIGSQYAVITAEDTTTRSSSSTNTTPSADASAGRKAPFPSKRQSKGAGGHRTRLHPATPTRQKPICLFSSDLGRRGRSA